MTEKKMAKTTTEVRRKKPGIGHSPGAGRRAKDGERPGTCPACGKPVGDRSKTCLSCGAVLDPSSIRQA